MVFQKNKNFYLEHLYSLTDVFFDIKQYFEYDYGHLMHLNLIFEHIY
jgi:hypothetical protein